MYMKSRPECPKLSATQNAVLDKLIIKYYNDMNQPLAGRDSISITEKFIIDANKIKPNTIVQTYYADKHNNFSTIGIGTDPARALMELYVNSADSVLERQVELHPEYASCKTVVELANKFCPDLEHTKPRERTTIARDWVTLERYFFNETSRKPVEGYKKNSPSEHYIAVIDEAQGMSPAYMLDTIFALHSNNKTSKKYLHGQFGQGGAGCLRFTYGVTTIISREQGTDEIGFSTITQTPADYDNINPVFMMIIDNRSGLPLRVNASKVKKAIACGTKICMYDFEYGKLKDRSALFKSIRRFLPDAVFPIRTDDHVDLNEKYESNKGKHAIGGFKFIAARLDKTTTTIADQKTILASTNNGKFEQIAIDDGYILVRAFVLTPESNVSEYFTANSRVIITINGQNQHEFDGRSKILNNYTYIGDDIVVQIKADDLTPPQKSILFSTNRELACDTGLLEEIRLATIDYINDIPEFKVLEMDAAKKAKLHSRKANADYKEILHSLNIGGENKPVNKERPGTGVITKKAKKLKSRLLTDCPTEIRFAHNSLNIAADQSNTRYVYAYTDADNSYNDNIVFSVVNNKGTHVVFSNQSALYDGEVKLGLDVRGSKVDDDGELIVQLTKKDGSILEDRIPFVVFSGMTKSKKQHKKRYFDDSVDIRYVAVTQHSPADDVYMLTKGNDFAGHIDATAMVPINVIYKAVDNEAVCYYSTSHHVISNCSKKLGKNKQLQEEYSATFERYLSYAITIGVYDNDETIISCNTAQALAIMAYDDVKKK